jgi:hypothetical protein
MKLEPKYFQALKSAVEEQSLYLSRIRDSANPAVLSIEVAMQTGDVNPWYEDCFFDFKRFVSWVDTGDTNGGKHVVAQIDKAKAKIWKEVRETIFF